eukprot:674839-Pleurochrysis_carterae.AAC.4
MACRVLMRALPRRPAAACPSADNVRAAQRARFQRHAARGSTSSGSTSSGSATSGSASSGSATSRLADERAAAVSAAQPHRREQPLQEPRGRRGRRRPALGREVLRVDARQRPRRRGVGDAAAADGRAAVRPDAVGGAPKRRRRARPEAVPPKVHATHRQRPPELRRHQEQGAQYTHAHILVQILRDQRAGGRLVRNVQRSHAHGHEPSACPLPPPLSVCGWLSAALLHPRPYAPAVDRRVRHLLARTSATPPPCCELQRGAKGVAQASAHTCLGSRLQSMFLSAPVVRACA